MTTIPILFIIFNREIIAWRSFQAIKKARPSKIYIASDGPRNKEEEKKVLATRKRIIEAIDWECEVKTLFQDINLGCGRGVYTAINWLFENEEQGIILEDDCIASETFFPYVEKMLELYKDDSRIGMVAGYNPRQIRNYPYSIIFSKFKGCWGWASWRRAWINMDFNMDWRKSTYATSIIANSGYQGRDRDKWIFELKSIDRKYVSAWDWQWYFSLARQNQLCIFPFKNQISNIGNDVDATHTSYSNIEVPSELLTFPLEIPECICPYEPFDRLIYKSDHSIRAYMVRLIPYKIKNIIKKSIFRL